MRTSKAGEGFAGDLSLVKRGQPGFLWSSSIEMPAGSMVDLRQHAVSKLVDVLGCVNIAQNTKPGLSRSALALYLKGCGMISDINTSEPSEELLSVFRQLTVDAPRFAPGWANLAFLEVQSWPSTPPRDRPALVRRTREHLRRAKQIDAELPVAIAADASLPEHWQNPLQALAIIERGLKVHPDSALLHGLRSESLATVGRTAESVDEALNAMQLNPLSPADRNRYLSTLAYAGRTNKAFDELKKAEAIWPGSEVLRQARYRLDLRYGDPRNALRLLKERGAGDLRPIPLDMAWQAFIEARIDPRATNVERALEAFRARYRRRPADIWGYVQALGTFGRVDEAFAAFEPDAAIDGAKGTPDTLFRVHMRPIYSDPRFMRVAHRLGLLGYWKQSDRWPDFCSDPRLPYDCRKEAAKYR